MSISLQVSTVRSEDLSIDNSQIIDQASPRNSVYLSPRKQPMSSLPALHEQHTGSTQSSSGDSVFDNIEQTKHERPYDNSTRHAHNDPTRHVSNVQPGRLANRYNPRSAPVASGLPPGQQRTLEASANRVEEALGIDYARFDEEPEEMTAWAIHAALIGFFSLVCLSLVLAFVVIHSYGFLTLLMLGVLVGFCIGLAIFVDRTVLQKNEKLKPIRNKIASAVTAAKNAIHEEIDSFKNEWREFDLLLTNGEEAESDGITTAPPTKKKKKSVMFKMVRPFLGAKKKLFKRKRKQDNVSQSTSSAAPVELV